MRVHFLQNNEYIIPRALRVARSTYGRAARGCARTFCACPGEVEIFLDAIQRENTHKSAKNGPKMTISGLEKVLFTTCATRAAQRGLPRGANMPSPETNSNRPQSGPAATRFQIPPANRSDVAGLKSGFSVILSKD